MKERYTKRQEETLNRMKDNAWCFIVKEESEGKVKCWLREGDKPSRDLGAVCLPFLSVHCTRRRIHATLAKNIIAMDWVMAEGEYPPRGMTVYSYFGVGAS